MKKSIIILLFALSINVMAQNAPYDSLNAPYDTLITEIKDFYDNLDHSAM